MINSMRNVHKTFSDSMNIRYFKHVCRLFKTHRKSVTENCSNNKDSMCSVHTGDLILL